MLDCRRDSWVYPRVGGGNLRTDTDALRHAGLSPRGRGKPTRRRPSSRRRRSIPAWAGETWPWPYTGKDGLGYPRVGGGNSSAGVIWLVVAGLSPRGRGKLCCISGMSSTLRSIPAWAGETWPWPYTGKDGLGYPRVGGGNSSAGVIWLVVAGLSPRGRGKHSIAKMNEVRRRSIPAWAGETVANAIISYRRRVYPRVGGGNR